MSLFPTLKTGAVAQYPATLRLSFGTTRSVEFLDGSSHRYSTGPKALRHWLVRMEHLDSAEAALVVSFIRANQAGSFSFTDPFTGDTVPRCVVEGRQVLSAISGELDHTTEFVIEELP